MRDAAIAPMGWAYLAHRLAGVGQAPANVEDFEARVQGVHVYPHGGALLHRHPRGCTSLAWRNCTMVLPGTREGLRLIGAASGSLLAQVAVRGKARNTRPVALRIREAADRVAALLAQDLAEGSVRRRVFFASLPSGKCVVAEQLLAREDLVVEELGQGYLSIINDGYFGDHADLRGRRRLFWARGEQEFVGFPAADDSQDVVVDLGDSRWLNVDDRFGLVFGSPGRALYRNKHFFKPFHAVEDEIGWIGLEQETAYKAGQTIAEYAVLWCPEQKHQDTEQQAFTVYKTPRDVFAARVNGFVCTGNFDTEPVVLPDPIRVPRGAAFPLSWGVSGAAEDAIDVRLRVASMEPAIIEAG